MAIGTITIFSGATIPDHYLVCDGSAISRQDYSELFSVIGDTYGPGDGSTTFNLPNMMANVPVGTSQNHALGETGGASDIILIEDNIPSHSHTIPQHGHSNNIVLSTPSLAHSITTQPAFKYVRANTGKPYNYSKGTTVRTGLAGATNMTRATNVAISDHPATDCTMSGGVTDCPAFDTEPAGGGDAHNNMMPYIALVFLIQAEEV